jgi:hypothetical protein
VLRTTHLVFVLEAGHSYNAISVTRPSSRLIISVGMSVVIPGNVHFIVRLVISILVDSEFTNLVKLYKELGG